MSSRIPLSVAGSVEPEGGAEVVGGEVEFFGGVLGEGGEDAVVANLWSGELDLVKGVWGWG